MNRNFCRRLRRRIEDLGVSEHLLIDIALRHVYLHGICSIHQLAELMKLSPEVAETLFRRLSDQQYFEVRRMSGDDYLFSLSSAGRRLATERAQIVVTPAPRRFH